MANATYDNLWREAIGELGEQLHVEGVDDLGDEVPMTATKQSSSPEVSIYQAFQHFACLYIKYLQIFRKLESCHDNMIHPQKRLHVKKVLELVIRRIIELKRDLVRWNPPNSYVQIPSGPEEAFPWEYVHLDDILVDLKLSPETLEIPVPKYFKEENAILLEQRDRLVSGYMRLKHNTDDIYIPDDYEVPVATEQMTIEKAIEIIQRNERGRQGVKRATALRDDNDMGMQKMLFSSTNAHSDKDPTNVDMAILNIQRSFKGYLGRNQAAEERANELMFIGMKSRKDNVDILNYELNMTYTKRKQEQIENRHIYETSLDDLKDVIMDEEGPEKRNEFREERTLWVTDQISQEKFPENLDDFYAGKLGLLSESEAKADEKSSKKGKDKDGDKGSDKKSGKGDKKSSSPKKGKSTKVEPIENAMPKLQGRTELTENIAKCVQSYEEIWESRDETSNFQQRHDVSLAKDVVRPNVYDEIRKQVDELLVMNLKKIKMQLEPKGKKGKKGGKKKKGKKGKKGGKGKKGKPLPGEKIAEMKGLDTDQMLSILIDYQLIVKIRPNRLISTIIGDFNYLGSLYHNADRRDEATWQPIDPSVAQLRQLLIEYCILPNGSSDIKSTCTDESIIKSVMLYGPSGTGKTHAVEAIANELNGLLIHLSPAKLRGIFQGKSGPTKLIHMIMTVARDPTMQPVVIYIDECEQFFVQSKKDKDGANRFKKDLMTYKNQALNSNHRVIIVGCTNKPENGDLKDYRSFFDKYLHFPYPDYSSRLQLWKYYSTLQIRDGILKSDPAYKDIRAPKSSKDAAELEISLRNKVNQIYDGLDISSLASISEGYSAGAIARTLRTVITSRRIVKIKSRPLANEDIVDCLAMQEVTYQDDRKVFLAFTRVITGLDERRKRVEAIVSGDTGNGKKGDKGKGKGSTKKGKK